MKVSSICVLILLLSISVSEHSFDNTWTELDDYFRDSLPDIALRDAIQNAKLVKVSPT